MCKNITQIIFHAETFTRSRLRIDSKVFKGHWIFQESIKCKYTKQEPTLIIQGIQNEKQTFFIILSIFLNIFIAVFCYWTVNHELKYLIWLAYGDTNSGGFVKEKYRGWCLEKTTFVSENGVRARTQKVRTTMLQ